MRLRGKGITLRGAEGASPPLPYVTVEDAEGKALLRLYPSQVERAFVDDAVADEPVPPTPVLRTDGPTVAEYVTAGYRAAGYPPPGYASRSTPEEVSAAIAEQEAAESARLAAAASEAVAESQRLASEAGGGSDAPDEAAKRIAEIAESFELLEPGDFVKTGGRAGKPKVDAVEAILGFNVSADEVDAAFAAKAAE